MRAVNLIPADQRESGVSLAGRSGGLAPLIVGLIVGLAVLVFLYGAAKHDESKNKSELAKVTAELSDVRAQVGRLAPYTSFIAMANQRVQDVTGLVQARFDFSHAFRELGRVLPRDTSLLTLQGLVGSSTGPSSAAAPPSAVSSATPTSTTPAGSVPSFALTGCATGQSEVAQTLQRLRLMDGVANVELQSAVKSSSSSSASAAAGGASSGASSGSCPAGSSTFAAKVTFIGLPSAPPTNPPAGGGSSASGGASAQTHGSKSISNANGGAR
jgi:hypothetical protein